MAINLPLFLQPDKAALLNLKINQDTGCFLFLRADQCCLQTPLTNYSSAFERISLSLYNIYHDYGRQFLWFFLDQNYIPNNLGLYTSNYNLIRKFKNHINDIQHCFRPNFAHGIFQDTGRITFQQKLNFYYLGNTSIIESYQNWPNFLNIFTESNWKSAVEKLISDSDDFYHYLEQWSTGWKLQPTGLHQLQLDFAQNRNFRYSFDRALCSDLLKANGVSSGNMSSYLNQSNMSRWQNSIISLYNSGTHQPTMLYQHLSQIIYQEVNPPATSSASIGAAYGFGIPY